MAWTFENDIIFGEIDNRIQGQVRGTLIFAGCPNPITFKIKGNCQPDLAGRCLVFFNPYANSINQNFPELNQGGAAGFISAQHKVQVSDEAPDYDHEKAEGRWHWETGITLEWFNPTEGRVYLELINCQTQVSTPTWELTPEQFNLQNNQTELLNREFIEQVLKTETPKSCDFCPEVLEKDNSEDEELRQRIQCLQKALGCDKPLGQGNDLKQLREEKSYLEGLMQFEGMQLCSSIPPAIEPDFPLSLTNWNKIPPENLCFELWRMIYGLAGCAIFVTMTDHLDYKRLYQLILDEIISSKKFSFRVGGGGWNHHFLMLDFADDLENLDDEAELNPSSQVILFSPSREPQITQRDKDLPTLRY